MSMSNTETSVTISLADLAKIEEKRVRDEETERARTREREARARHATEQKRRAEEEARLAAMEEARARQLREAALEKGLLDAREKAAIEIARIDAEARARLETENAARGHELSVFRTRRETGRRRREIFLASALAVFLFGGAVAANEASTRLTKAQQSAEELREGQRAFSRERDDAKRTELDALDRRLEALSARPGAKSAEEARKIAEVARVGLDPNALDHGRLRAFADAIDAFGARVDAVEKLAGLDRRFADLTAWAASVRRSDATAAAKSAGLRARSSTAGPEAIAAYDKSLD